MWDVGRQAQQDIPQLLAVQASQQFIKGWAHFYLIRLALAGQQHSDDVLAPVAPIVRAIAGRAGEIAFVKRDLHAVGFVLAAFDLSLHHVAALYHGEHRAFPVIALAPAERLARGLPANSRFAKGWDRHFTGLGVHRDHRAFPGVEGAQQVNVESEFLLSIRVSVFINMLDLFESCRTTAG